MAKLLLALGLAGSFAGAPFIPVNYSTPSNSMVPTLSPGDYLIFPMLFKSPPKRGDIIVFSTSGPSGRPTAFVKRVVALPGETVRYRDGALQIDGVEVTRVEVEPPANLPDAVVGAKFFRETAGEASYEIAEMGDDGFLDNTSDFTTPPGAYFTLGDNRDNSTDSRISQIGFVSEQAVMGRVCLVYRFPVTFRYLCG